MYTHLEKKNAYSDLVAFYLTSKGNSPGLFFDGTWKDGKPVQITMEKNTLVTYNMQPQITKHLEQMGKCQKESYYKCIASQLDVTEFKECSKKCIPNVFSNMNKNYSTEFCHNDTDSQQCIFKHMLKQEFGSNCKKSCSYLEYFGEFVLQVPYTSEFEDWNVYWLRCKFTNYDFAANVVEEYLIYDPIGMIGSVGGTLGIYMFYF